MFGKPQRTTHAVFVPIEARHRLVINDISHISIRPSARTPGGFTLVARFPTDTWAGEQLEILDTAALAATLENNRAWFKNGLTEGQINEFFEPSIEVLSNKLAKATFHISAKHLPQISYDNRDVGTIDAFYEKWSADPHRGPNAVFATATIDVAGILFEKQRFRLRLMLRAIEATAPLRAAAAEELVPDRRELEEHWRGEVEAKLNPQITEQEARLQKLISLKQDLLRQIDMAERTKDGPTWDAHLATVAQTLRELSYIEYRPAPNEVQANLRDCHPSAASSVDGIHLPIL